jgi:hypothetical protein
MGNLLKAVTATGTIDANGQLHLNDPLPVSGPSRVHVILLITEDEREIEEAAWLRAAATNPTFDFLNEEEEVYTLADGKPFHDQPASPQLA